MISKEYLASHTSAQEATEVCKEEYIGIKKVIQGGREVKRGPRKRLCTGANSPQTKLELVRKLGDFP